MLVAGRQAQGEQYDESQPKPSVDGLVLASQGVLSLHILVLVCSGDDVVLSRQGLFTRIILFLVWVG